MLFEILTHTPIWVFVLFFVLLILGILQSKKREISLKRAILLPIAMILLSLYGEISAFGINTLGITIWLIGILLAVVINKQMKCSNFVSYDKENKVFTIEGSFRPLFLMMMIFFTKYIVGVVTAKNLPILYTTEFIVAISFLYGFLSGAFFGRFLNIIEKMKDK